MFGRKKVDGPGTAATDAATAASPAPASPAEEKTAAPAAGHPLRQSLQADAPRRAVEIPGAAPAPQTAGGLRAPGAVPQPPTKETASVTAPDPKTLIVGREISLTGDITACDRLIVEGRIEANLKDCRFVEIAESGLFKGNAEIGDADISGGFEGALKVNGRLIIRATGTVRGEVEYGELEIECGGRIQGAIKAPAAVAVPASLAAKA